MGQMFPMPHRHPSTAVVQMKENDPGAKSFLLTPVLSSVGKAYLPELRYSRRLSSPLLSLSNLTKFLAADSGSLWRSMNSSLFSLPALLTSRPSSMAPRSLVAPALGAGAAGAFPLGLPFLETLFVWAFSAAAGAMGGGRNFGGRAMTSACLALVATLTVSCGSLTSS